MHRGLVENTVQLCYGVSFQTVPVVYMVVLGVNVRYCDTSKLFIRKAKSITGSAFFVG